MRLSHLLLAAAMAAPLAAGDSPRAVQEARALEVVQALADGAKRDAGLRIVRQAWQAFHDDAAAAALPVPDDATPERRARLADLAQRNASLAAQLRLPAAELPAMAEAHLARWPLDDEVRILLCSAQLAAGDRDAAWRNLDAALILAPAQPQARELRGRLSVDSTDPAVADMAAEDLAPLLNRLLEEGCAAASDPIAVQAALAAITPLARAVRGTQGEGRLAALRALAAAQAEDWPRALEQWRLAAAAGITQPDPTPQVRALVRRLHADRVDPAIAARDLAAMRELSPAFPERDDLQDRLFRMLLVGGQLGEVVVAARGLLAADPTHPLGLLLADGAAAALDDRRLELLPPFIARLRLSAPLLGTRFPVVYGLDAALAESIGDVQGAAAALDPLLAADPADRAARWQRARLRLAAGDAPGAQADCDLLLEGSADDADVIGLRARIRATTGDAAGARSDADRVLALRPGCAALLTHARILAQLGDPAGVRADFEAMVPAAQGAADVPILLEAADQATEQKNDALVRSLLEKASQLGSAEAALRLRRLRR
jgi:tetratricopeptide (TPR) repeat protein